MKKNKQYFLIVIIVYILLFGTLGGTLIANQQIISTTQGKIILGVSLGVLSLIYWIVFIIIYRQGRKKD